jgi:VWFA-related protein
MTMNWRGLVSVVALGLSAAAWGQAPVAGQAGATSDPKQVRMDVTVVGKDGEPVEGLTEKDFKLRDFTHKDTKAGVPITSFKAVAAGQSEVRVILLIDAVNIPFSAVSTVRLQVLKYLRGDEGKLAQPMTIAVLSDQGVEMQQGYTKDGNVLAAGLEKEEIGLREIGRSGGAWGAEERLQISLKATHDLAAYGKTLPGRKVVLWISAGWPLLSGPEVNLIGKQQEGIFSNIVQLSTGLRETKMTIYNINPLGATQDLRQSLHYETFLDAVNKPSDVQLGDLGLQVLAVQSGGLVMTGSTDVAGLLKRCVRETTAWYEIGFEMGPAEKDVYHHVVVEVDKAGLVARTRAGYYELR